MLALLAVMLSVNSGAVFKHVTPPEIKDAQAGLPVVPASVPVFGKNICSCAAYGMNACLLPAGGEYKPASFKAYMMTECSAPATVKIKQIARYDRMIYLEWEP